MWGTHLYFTHKSMLLPIFLICRCSGQLAYTNLFRDSEINDQTNLSETLRFSMFDFSMIRTCDFKENKHLLFSHALLSCLYMFPSILARYSYKLVLLHLFPLFHPLLYIILYNITIDSSDPSIVKYRNLVNGNWSNG